MAATLPLAGQTQNQTTTDPTLLEAQAQQQILTAQQAQADAKLKMLQDQQSMLTGMLPSSSAAPKAGSFTVTGTNPFDSQLLAYRALSPVATEIAKNATSGVPIVIYDQTEINNLANYQSVLQVLNLLQVEVANLKSTFTNQLEPEAQKVLTLPKQDLSAVAVRSFAGVLAPGLALGGLKTLSDLIGMFRTDTNIAFSTFANDDTALTAEVARALVAGGKEVYSPAMMPLSVTTNTSTFMSALSKIETDLMNLQNSAIIDQSKVQQVSDALNAYIQADQALQANTDSTKTAGLTNAKTTAGNYAQGLLGVTSPGPLDVAKAGIWKAKCDQFLKELGQFTTSVAGMVTSLATLQTSLTAVTNTGSATFTAILRAERLLAKASSANAQVLMVKTSVLGGSVVTRQNLFTGGHLLYTGGAIASFTLFDAASGKVLASGVVPANTGEKQRKF